MIGALDCDEDAPLLAHFAADRDEPPSRPLCGDTARWCWRSAAAPLADANDAEDVFQAAFLILARKADSIRSTDSLAAWLHRTASAPRSRPP